MALRSRRMVAELNSREYVMTLLDLWGCAGREWLRYTCQHQPRRAYALSTLTTRRRFAIRVLVGPASKRVQINDRKALAPSMVCFFKELKKLNSHNILFDSFDPAPGHHQSCKHLTFKSFSASRPHLMQGAGDFCSRTVPASAVRRRRGQGGRDPQRVCSALPACLWSTRRSP